MDKSMKVFNSLHGSKTSSDMEWEESCVPVQQSREAKSSNQLQNTTVETNCNGQITQSLRRQSKFV